MAKSKPAKADKSQPILGAIPKKPAAKTARKPAAKKPATPKPATTSVSDNSFTGIAIGHAAGEVWGALSNGGPRTIAEISKSVEAPGDVIIAAVGWLAREDKLEFDTSGKTVKIGLK